MARPQRLTLLANVTRVSRRHLGYPHAAMTVGELVSANVVDQRVWDTYGEQGPPGVYLLGIARHGAPVRRHPRVEGRDGAW